MPLYPNADFSAKTKPTGVILAGGRGSRIGGNDKALLQFRQRPLIEHIIERLSPQVSNIILNVNRNQAQFSQYGYPLIQDSEQKYYGPLFGILSVMEALYSNHHEFNLMVVPCDTPQLPSNLCAQLQQAKDKSNNPNKAVIAHDGNRLQPLFILLSAHHLPELKAFIHSGNKKVLDWIDLIQPTICKFKNAESAFYNINTIKDLHNIEQQTPK